jgi:diadenosine tetraphosphate (Ap4A) HIT family hydrolase
LAVAVLDAYPVSPGHALIVARRHVPSYFDLSPVEVSALHELLAQVQVWIETKHRPHGYTVGVNVGPAAGQTVMHVHLHLIPRYSGDVQDPVGGVRNIIPGRGRYRQGP